VTKKGIFAGTKLNLTVEDTDTVARDIDGDRAPGQSLPTGRRRLPSKDRLDPKEDFSFVTGQNYKICDAQLKCDNTVDL
jgi:hypothetical protein